MLDRVPRPLLIIIPLFLAALLTSSCLLGRGPAKPAVTILSPMTNAQLPLAVEVQVESIALDESGIVSVELWVNGQLERVDAAAKPEGVPVLEVSQSWTPSIQGRHNLAVVAVNRSGVSSEPAMILVDVVPAVALEQPPATPSTPEPAMSLPTVTPTPTRSEVACTNNAVFVADVSVPDGTPFKPGEAFVKVWRMQNAGTCDWSAGYHWVFESGDRLGAQPSIPVPPTAAGAQVDLRVAMTASQDPGTYIGRWRFQGPDGQPFGQRAVVVIVVTSADLAAPAAPTNPVASLTEEGGVLLSWDLADKRADGVRVYAADGTSVVVELRESGVRQALLESVPCDTELGYILRAYNQAGESPPTSVIRLQGPPCPSPLPVIQLFIVRPAAIDRGQVAVLSWDLDGAREARVFPGGESGVVAPGSMEVSPSETTTYRLVATNEHGSVEERVTLEVRAATGAGPTVTIIASSGIVGELEKFQVKVIGRDENGIDSIWWQGSATGDPVLDTLHAFQCEGQAVCAKDWVARSKVAGTLTLKANARSVSGVQSDHVGTLPVTTLKVVPILVSAEGIRLTRGSCLDIDRGVTVACDDPAADLAWGIADEGGDNSDTGKTIWIAGQHGASVTLLGVKLAPTYLEMAAANYKERITVAAAEVTLLAHNTVIGVRSTAGHLSTITVTPTDGADTDTLTLRLVTYAE